MSSILIESLTIYALAFVISGLVAVLIKVIDGVLGRFTKTPSK